MTPPPVKSPTAREIHPTAHGKHPAAHRKHPNAREKHPTTHEKHPPPVKKNLHPVKWGSKRVAFRAPGMFFKNFLILFLYILKKYIVYKYAGAKKKAQDRDDDHDDHQTTRRTKDHENGVINVSDMPRHKRKPE